MRATNGRTTEDQLSDIITRPNSEWPNIVGWRIASVAGVAIVLLVALIQSLGAHPMQYRSLYWLIVAAFLIPITIRIFFPDSWQGLFQNPDLLIPVGIAWLVSKAFAWLTLLPGLGNFLTTSWQGSIFGISLAVSVSIVFYVFVWSAYASWQIDLIWQYVRQGCLIEISPWPAIRKGFWRALVVLVLGHGILLLALIPALAVGMIGFLIIGIGWNLITVALMPIALSESRTLVQGIKEGLLTSWEEKDSWMIQLGVQLTLLGMITYLVASYQADGTYHSDSSFTVSAFWVGAFENDFRWHSKYMAMIKTVPLPFAVAMLEMLFIVLAVSMKIYVMKRLPADFQNAK